MIRISFFLIILLEFSAVAGTLTCPQGSIEVGSAPPLGYVTLCVKMDGTRNGSFKTWDKEKKLKRHGTYEDDIVQGPYTEFHKNGQKAMTGEFKDGKMHGHWTRYYENGKIKDEGDWDLGIPVGKWKHWHANGKVSAEGIFKDEKKDCSWKYYDRTGANISKVDAGCSGDPQALTKDPDALALEEPLPMRRFTTTILHAAYLYPSKNGNQVLSLEPTWAPWMRLRNAPYGLGLKFGLLPINDSIKNNIRFILDYQVNAFFLKPKFTAYFGLGAVTWLERGTYPSATLGFSFLRKFHVSYTGFINSSVERYIVHLMRLGFEFDFGL